MTTSDDNSRVALQKLCADVLRAIEQLEEFTAPITSFNGFQANILVKKAVDATLKLLARR